MRKALIGASIALLVTMFVLIDCSNMNANASNHMRAVLKLPDGEVIDGDCSYYSFERYTGGSGYCTEVYIDGVTYIVPIGSTDLVIIKD